MVKSLINQHLKKENRLDLFSIALLSGRDSKTAAAGELLERAEPEKSERGTRRSPQMAALIKRRE